MTLKQISLSQNKFTLVDEADYDWLNRWKWYACQDGTTWYAVRAIRDDTNKQYSLRMHRQILGLERGDNQQCDHIDHDGLNNQRANLRICTPRENCFNRKSRKGNSRFKGVCWHKQNYKWMAGITHNGKHIHLGYFEDETEAGEAYDREAKEIHGEFICLNFPEGEK